MSQLNVEKLSFNADIVVQEDVFKLFKVITDFPCGLVFHCGLDKREIVVAVER